MALSVLLSKFLSDFKSLHTIPSEIKTAYLDKCVSLCVFRSSLLNVSLCYENA